MKSSGGYFSQVLKGELVGVEIGVEAGWNALQMLEHLNIKKLYLVDPYIGYMGKDGIEYRDGYTDVPGEEELITSRANAKQAAHELLEKHKDKIVWIEKTSDDALVDIPDELDFVYIDGNHNYEYVKSDIENYSKKIRKGGVLAGHDYNDPRHPGVTKAVHEFIKNDLDKLKLQLIDWAIQC